MPNDGEQRMIHIRIDSDVHRELRKVAAEFDVTIQDIVANAVEESVDALLSRVMMERERELLEREAQYLEREKIAEEAELLQEEIQREMEDHEAAFTEYHDSVIKRLDDIHGKVEALMDGITRIQESLSRE